MAQIVSCVELTSNHTSEKFLVSGIPRDYDDLEGWTDFDDFLVYLTKDQEVSVQVNAYLYGKGRARASTLEELEKLTKELKSDPQFLDKHAAQIEVVQFSINWSPSELFGNGLSEI